ncbi:hypothetical protein [Salipiger marinus]|uniref:Uncharacterized protein n=1 Tax=Salipiger marinus TaxID=555512 RepID=A0A1G8UPV6_9RHOB|nr:hypothetical protein [Salipiger marinus]SDJ55527.1 hypothetical protein SAMN04487993_10468 [Salipiger marinus]
MAEVGVMTSTAHSAARASRFFIPAAIALSGSASTAESYELILSDSEVHIAQSCSFAKSPVTKPIKGWGSRTLKKVDEMLISSREAKHTAFEIERYIDAVANANWINSAFRSEDWKSAFDQFELIHELEDGWDGDRSVPAEAETLADSKALLETLEGSSVRAPRVGLDADGIVVLTWRTGTLDGVISIYGDGTFTYYFEGEANVASDGEGAIGNDLDPQLVELLSV